jgi:hypothetical protein
VRTTEVQAVQSAVSLVVRLVLKGYYLLTICAKMGKRSVERDRIKEWGSRGRSVDDELYTELTHRLTIGHGRQDREKRRGMAIVSLSIIRRAGGRQGEEVWKSRAEQEHDIHSFIH